VFDQTLIDPAYPDYDRMRQIVQDAIAPPDAPADATPADVPADATTADVPASATPSAPAGPSGAEEPAADVGDACAYDRARAEEALAAGKPETKNG
jgi:hypothetical protein